MKKTTVTAAIAALSMAGVMMLAAPAYADAENVTDTELNCAVGGGDSVDVDNGVGKAYLEDLCLTSGSIDDAWTLATDDAYDDFGFVGSYNQNGSRYVFTGESTVNDGETFTFVDTDVYSYLEEAFVDAHVTRTFIGNTVTWSVDVFLAGTTTPATLDLFIDGDLGSDGDTVFTEYDTYLLSMDSYETDPYLLWKSTGMSNHSDGSDEPSFDFPESSSATLQNILVGYQCNYEDALDEFLTAVDADWAAYANIDLAELGEPCFTAAGTTTFERNVAVDTILTFDGLDNFNWNYGGDGEIYYPLPEGLSFEVLNDYEEDTVPSIRIFGTPTVAGTTNADIGLWDDYGMESYILVPFTVVNEAVAADVAMKAAVGDLVAGSEVTYQADGLQVGAAWTLTARSTPQIIAQGTVPVSGSISGVATIPANLEAGWHTLTLESTDNTGAALTRVVYFEIGSNGQLLSSNYTGIPAVEAAVDNVEPIVEAELAATGFSGGNGALGALALALAGTLLLGAAVRRRNLTHTV